MPVWLAGQAAMTCPACGMNLSGYDITRGVCSHHAASFGEDWAGSNRVMCDFVHRGVVPPRLAAPDRDDDFWANAASDSA